MIKKEDLQLSGIICDFCEMPEFSGIEFYFKQNPENFENMNFAVDAMLKLISSDKFDSVKNSKFYVSPNWDISVENHEKNNRLDFFVKIMDWEWAITEEMVARGAQKNLVLNYLFKDFSRADRVLSASSPEPSLIGIDKIDSFQYFYYPEKVERYSSMPEESVPPIVVIERNGRFYLINGVHRTIVAQNRGNSQILAQVYPYENQ